MPLKELAERRNLLHRNSDPQTILKHGLADPLIGKVAVVSSFGAESVVLLHMVAQIDQQAPVLFIDTEMLFEETLQYQRDIVKELGLTAVHVITPSRDDILVNDVDGLLHQADTTACCALRKVRPLQTALADYDGWVTGRKRYQNGSRAALPHFEMADRRIKINPLAHWSREDIANYMARYDLPRHPMVARGYPSIGCSPCTTRVADHEDPRAGRWRDQGKTECGIHFTNTGAVQKTISPAKG